MILERAFNCARVGRDPVLVEKAKDLRFSFSGVRTQVPAANIPSRK